MPNKSTSTTTEEPTTNQKSFKVEGVDGHDTIVLRRLRAMDKIDVGIRQSVLLRGGNATNFNMEVQEFSYMFSLLQVALVEPKDFPFNELEEEDLVALWKEWDEWGRSFRNNRRRDVEETS